MVGAGAFITWIHCGSRHLISYRTRHPGVLSVLSRTAMLTVRIWSVETGERDRVIHLGHGPRLLYFDDNDDDSDDDGGDNGEYIEASRSAAIEKSY